MSVATDHCIEPLFKQFDMAFRFDLLERQPVVQSAQFYRKLVKQVMQLIEHIRPEQLFLMRENRLKNCLFKMLDSTAFQYLRGFFLIILFCCSVFTKNAKGFLSKI